VTDTKNNKHSLLVDYPSNISTEQFIPGRALVLPPDVPSQDAKQSQQNTTAAKADTSQVTVAPNLADLVAGTIESPEEERAVRIGRNLNEVVHFVLIVGLGISTALILIGLGLDLVRHRQVPTSVPSFGEAFRLMAALRPSGFLTVGLLVLVATPILRVVGSTIAFLYERDWRYVAITLIVLVVVSLSLILGQG